MGRGLLRAPSNTGFALASLPSSNPEGLLHLFCMYQTRTVFVPDAGTCRLFPPATVACVCRYLVAGLDFTFFTVGGVCVQLLLRAECHGGCLGNRPARARTTFVHVPHGGRYCLPASGENNPTGHRHPVSLLGDLNDCPSTLGTFAFQTHPVTARQCWAREKVSTLRVSHPRCTNAHSICLRARASIVDAPIMADP